jgi:glucose-1-phosphate thymidylyltransferase
MKTAADTRHACVGSCFFALYMSERALQTAVACPEEIAFHQKWINAESLQKLTRPLAKNGYGQYQLNLPK